MNIFLLFSKYFFAIKLIKNNYLKYKLYQINQIWKKYKQPLKKTYNLYKTWKF